MKKLAALLLAGTLAGCATAPIQQATPVLKPHKAIKAAKPAPTPAPVIVLPPASEPVPKSQTFKQRFRSTFGHIRWLHPK